MAFVSLFVKRKPPESPTEEFFDNHLQKFLTDLTTPSTDWLVNQTKLEAHLGT